MSVGEPVVGLKGALNIGKLIPVFPVRFVASRLALNPAFAGNMLVDTM